ncbi:hypothetical protein L7F22_067954 [Adiantum nelumboides]|nr:hypothetical protein [Adiantum nelumboides]
MLPSKRTAQSWLALIGFVSLIYQVSFINSLPSSRPITNLQSRQSNNGDSSVLSWDKDTFTIAGEKVWLNSFEFHPWRLPVPELWRDPLQKLKAAGYNTVSIYTHWGLIMPSPDPSSVSLDAPANRLADFLTIAKEVGLFVILRPGPYINAETTGGGMPGWVQNLETQLRTNTTVFNDAWKPYMKAIVDAAVPFQVKASSNSLDTSGGTLLGVQVENEFTDSSSQAAYFEEIINFYRANGITVPTTFNALSGTDDYDKNTQLDIWGQDSYPQGFDCANPTKWSGVYNYTELNQLRTTNPASIPEFQGGSYDAWGGSTYDNCALLTNSTFVRVFDKSVLGDGVKFLSRYMGFGGTNWGNLAFGGLVYTSYDYGAGLNEKRIIREKLRESTLLGSFLQSFPSFANSAVQQQDKNLGISEQSEDIVVSHLKQIDGGNSSWYLVRHSDSTSSSIATFRLSVEDGKGNQITIPQQNKMSLVGRDAILVPVDAPLPSSGLTLNYSTSDVSFLGTIGQQDVMVLHGFAGYSYEFGLTGGFTATSQDSSVKIQQVESGATIQWTPAQNAAQNVQVKTSNGKQLLIRLVDIEYAQALGFPSTSSVGTLDGILGRGDRVVVHGAYHIANATLSSDGSTLALSGHLNGTSTSDLDIIAPESVKQITFNGGNPTSSSTNNQSLQASFAAVPEDVLSFEAPALSDWKYQDSLPEIQQGYVPDSNWRSANLTTTSNAWFANANTTNVLFADAYGFHSGGAILWQGRFNNSNVDFDQLSVTFIGGKFFSSSTFLNDKFVGATDVPSSSTQASATFTITKDMIVQGENVFTVLMDSTGLQEDGGNAENVNGYQYPREDTKQPRGILQFDILSGGKAQTDLKLDWIVTGNQGGENLLDKVRGPLNEGGLYAERQGWHLPGFDDSKWSTIDPTSSEGGVNGSSVRFYRTSVSLNVPDGYDIPMSLVYDGKASDSSQTWKSLFFINGWQYGKRFVQFGPQTNFPIPHGILDPKGENTIAVALWSPDSKGATLPKLSLEKQGVFVGPIDYSVNNPTYQQVRG